MMPKECIFIVSGECISSYELYIILRRFLLSILVAIKCPQSFLIGFNVFECLIEAEFLCEMVDGMLLLWWKQSLK